MAGIIELSRQYGWRQSSISMHFDQSLRLWLEHLSMSGPVTPQIEILVARPPDAAKCIVGAFIFTQLVELSHRSEISPFVLRKTCIL